MHTNSQYSHAGKPCPQVRMTQDTTKINTEYTLVIPHQETPRHTYTQKSHSLVQPYPHIENRLYPKENLTHTNIYTLYTYTQTNFTNFTWLGKLCSQYTLTCYLTHLHSITQFCKEWSCHRKFLTVSL
eukprot:c40053_g1_i1 orf=3-383(-)